VRRGAASGGDHATHRTRAEVEVGHAAGSRPRERRRNPRTRSRSRRRPSATVSRAPRSSSSGGARRPASTCAATSGSGVRDVLVSHPRRAPRRARVRRCARRPRPTRRGSAARSGKRSNSVSRWIRTRHRVAARAVREHDALVPRHAVDVGMQPEPRRARSHPHGQHGYEATCRKRGAVSSASGAPPRRPAPAAWRRRRRRVRSGGPQMPSRRGTAGCTATATRRWRRRPRRVCRRRAGRRSSPGLLDRSRSGAPMPRRRAIAATSPYARRSSGSELPVRVERRQPVPARLHQHAVERLRHETGAPPLLHEIEEDAAAAVPRAPARRRAARRSRSRRRRGPAGHAGRVHPRRAAARPRRRRRTSRRASAPRRAVEEAVRDESPCCVARGSSPSDTRRPSRERHGCFRSSCFRSFMARK
jgi:hypothetical protein